MPTLSGQALVALTVALGALGSPLNPHIGVPLNDASTTSSGKFSLKQVRNPNYKFIGPLSVKKTYLKYGIAVPPWLEAAVQTYAPDLSKRGTGSAATSPIDNQDTAYITPVQIGTPAQTLNLDFDTGSSDLWVFSSETPSNEINGQSIYNPGNSSTAKQLSGASWSISYGDGSSSSGNVYQDTVSVGGLAVQDQAVELAKTVSSSFTQESPVDGLLGLAFSSINTVTPQKQKTFFDNAKASLDSPVFTVDLGFHSPGTYDFGFINDSAYKGNITYTSVSTRRGFWEWTSTGYSVGSSPFQSTSIDGIADTGTTLLYLPNTAVQAYWSQVSGAQYSASAGGYVFPCSAKLPNFTYGVESARIVIPGDHMDFGPISTGSTTCFGGLQDSADIGINIFGDVALKAAYVVFDGASTPRLGFASK